jgi:hypothetical protein
MWSCIEREFRVRMLGVMSCTTGQTDALKGHSHFCHECDLELLATREIGRHHEMFRHQEGPATHLCLVLMACRSYEKKRHFTGPPRRIGLGRREDDQYAVLGVL